MSKSQAVKALEKLRDKLPDAVEAQNDQWWGELHALINKYIGPKSPQARTAQYGTFNGRSPLAVDAKKAEQLVEACISIVSGTGTIAQKKLNWLQAFDNKIINTGLVALFGLGSLLGWLSKDTYYQREFEGCHKVTVLLTARLDSMMAAVRPIVAPAHEQPAEDKGINKGQSPK